MRRTLALAVAFGALALAPAAEAGITVTGSKQLTARLLDVAMTSDALAKPVHTRILLPDGYEQHPEKRYPVLFLLHGGFGNVADWTTTGDAEAITAGKDVIVVMPEDGAGGWYTDWYNGGTGGPPRWETFHIRQLLPWVDGTYRTVADRGQRAVAGLSTGGFGAMTYATRHPDLFSYAASFSGAVDLVHNVPVVLVIGAEAMTDGGGPEDVFGSRIFNEMAWRAHNPWDLAENARGLRLWVGTGNGIKGPLNASGDLPYDPVEGQVYEMSKWFHNRLANLDIPHTWNSYGPGTHAWAYWRRDLRQILPEVLDAFAHPPAPPARVDFKAAEREYESYGWQVSIDRPVALEFSRLTLADARGFTLTGRGHAIVTTPALYPPGSPHKVQIGGSTFTLNADGAGRLRLTLPYTPRPDSRTTVEIDP
jgi:S-formylglutathione hydrolase FrmB